MTSPDNPYLMIGDPLPHPRETPKVLDALRKIRDQVDRMILDVEKNVVLKKDPE